MQTFTFDELDERGQQAATMRHFDDALATTTREDLMRYLTSTWRFNEHGERIA